MNRTVVAIAALARALVCLREAAREALANRQGVSAFRISGPYTFDVEFHNSAQAELPLLLPGVKRTAARAVSFAATDYIEGFKLLRAIIALAGIS